MSVAWPRVPAAVFSTTTTGIERADDAGHRADGTVVVARRERSMRPAAAIADASSAFAAQPSNRIAPMTAPWTGPGIRSHSIGGPEWSS